LTRDGKDLVRCHTEGPLRLEQIPHIEASHCDPAEAYAAVGPHRLDDYKPHLFRTRDSGKTWSEIGQWHRGAFFSKRDPQDPRRKGLLFAGTELGSTYPSTTAITGNPLQLNLPGDVGSDLVMPRRRCRVATHGRSFWILDDIAPLRQIDSKLLTSDGFLCSQLLRSGFRGAVSRATPGDGVSCGKTAGWGDTRFSTFGRRRLVKSRWRF